MHSVRVQTGRARRGEGLVSSLTQCSTAAVAAHHDWRGVLPELWSSQSRVLTILFMIGKWIVSLIDYSVFDIHPSSSTYTRLMDTRQHAYAYDCPPTYSLCDVQSPITTTETVRTTTLFHYDDTVFCSSSLTTTSARHLDDSTTAVWQQGTMHGYSMP